MQGFIENFHNASVILSSFYIWVTLYSNYIKANKYKVHNLTFHGLIFVMNPSGDISRWTSVLGTAAIAQLTYAKNWTAISSQLSRCCWARGSSTEFSRVLTSLNKVKARKFFHFCVGFWEVEFKKVFTQIKVLHPLNQKWHKFTFFHTFFCLKLDNMCTLSLLSFEKEWGLIMCQTIYFGNVKAIA